MPCDPASDDARPRTRRRSLLTDIVVVFGLLPPYVLFYPVIWVRNHMLTSAWKRLAATAVRGRWRLEGDQLRLCLEGHDRVVGLGSIRAADWTEHVLIRRFVGTDASEFLVSLELSDGERVSVVLTELDADDAVFCALRACGKLRERPRTGGQEQGAGTVALFVAGWAVTWVAMALFGLWLRRPG